MTRRERLMASLRGEPVDRPPVSFYDLGGLDENPADPDPYNIYSHPSWAEMVKLTRDRTDRIVTRYVAHNNEPGDPLNAFYQTVSEEDDRSLRKTKTIPVAGGRTLTCRTRRDRDTNTIWTEEHLLKDADDLRAFLDVCHFESTGAPDISGVLETEERLGDTGIVIIDTPDPLCCAAALFDMGEYTIVALTEQDLFHELLSRFAAILRQRTEAVAQAAPGRLWRIYGPEYASPPYLPPSLFKEYVCAYDRPMIESIQRYGGFARLHSHGNLRAIIDDIADLKPDALDPIEPPPQGDMQLREIRERFGKDMTLFGNLEVSDLENLPTDRMAEKIQRAIDEGTTGEGRGFVLMPSAAPYGRELSPLTLRNYTKMVEMVEAV